VINLPLLSFPSGILPSFVQCGFRSFSSFILDVFVSSEVVLVSSAAFVFFFFRNFKIWLSTGIFSAGFFQFETSLFTFWFRASFLSLSLSSLLALDFLPRAS